MFNNKALWLWVPAFAGTTLNFASAIALPLQRSSALNHHRLVRQLVRAALRMREILSQLARHRGDAVDHALLEPACAKIGFHRAADRAPTGLADLGVDTAVSNDLDVAVGVQSDGFDAWNEQTAISRHLGVGAPPDPLNTAGQDWGLAGFNAAGLEQRSFEPFRQMLRASMHHAGAIRLDHAFGLKRLYLVPRGFGPANGAYVLMPFEALLAATAQESAASRCVVIGEDLGTVPPGFREQMNGWGI